MLNTPARTLSAVHSQVSAAFISAGGLVWTSTHRDTGQTAFHFSGWSVSNGSDGWASDARTESGGLSSKTTQKSQSQGEGERKENSKEGLEKSFATHTHLWMPTLDFFAFYPYVTHTLYPPTPTVWQATLITKVFQAFISSSWWNLHLFSSFRQDDRENKGRTN